MLIVHVNVQLLSDELFDLFDVLWSDVLLNVFWAEHAVDCNGLFIDVVILLFNVEKISY